MKKWSLEAFVYEKCGPAHTSLVLSIDVQEINHSDADLCIKDDKTWSLYFSILVNPSKTKIYFLLT